MRLAKDMRLAKSLTAEQWSEVAKRPDLGEIVRRVQEVGRRLRNRTADEARPGWDTSILYCRQATRGTRRVVFTVGRLGRRLGRQVFFAGAIEGDVRDRTIDEAFDNHAHAVIGDRFRTAAGAQRACEKYERQWLRKRKPAKRCSCKKVRKG